jgi:uncharacterized protein YkwD
LEGFKWLSTVRAIVGTAVVQHGAGGTASLPFYIARFARCGIRIRHKIVRIRLSRQPHCTGVDHDYIPTTAGHSRGRVADDGAGRPVHRTVGHAAGGIAVGLRRRQQRHDGRRSQAVVPPTTGAPPTTVPQQPGAPTLTGNTAFDGFTWINYRRAQLGLSTLTRNANIDLAAQGHSDYLRLNNTVTHEQTQGKPGFTGATLKDRLLASNYALSGGYAIGEVISAATNNSGFYQAEELITAIYHRFVIFEPVFKEIGTGAATANGSYTYFTADFTAVNGYSNSGIGSGNMITYPFNGQTAVPTNFFSDSESPDPVPGQNEVGYPISVHTDTAATNSGHEVVVQASPWCRAAARR